MVSEESCSSASVAGSETESSLSSNCEKLMCGSTFKRLDLRTPSVHCVTFMTT